MGLFGKKESVEQPVAFSNQQASVPTPEQIELPDVPPVEELDLPPPPQYPKLKQEERPAIPQTPTPQPMPFRAPLPSPKVEKIEVPMEQLFRPGTITKPIIPPEELSREKILHAIGAMPTEPLFVRVEDYREIMDSTTLIRSDLKEATDLALRLQELKNEEDKEFEKWRLELEDVHRKLMYVDKVIFESK